MSELFKNRYIYFAKSEGMSLSYLALGDSYTIGEGVELSGSFPCQAVQILRRQNMSCYTPEIIAKTGWTTDELSAAIEKTMLLPKYDVVSLLIGVNNQYRGRSVNEFKVEFDHLLQKSIQLSGNHPNNVFILSIPDWGVSPFAAIHDRKKIEDEINVFNEVCKKGTASYGTVYLDITTSQRQDGNKPEFLAADGLHPSAREYAKWAENLVQKISGN